MLVGIPGSELLDDPRIIVSGQAIDRSVQVGDQENLDFREASLSTTASVDAGRSSALAFADFGILRASASAPLGSVLPECESSNCTTSANAEAHFSDFITISNPDDPFVLEGMLRLDFRFTGRVQGFDSAARANGRLDISAAVGVGDFLDPKSVNEENISELLFVRAGENSAFQAIEAIFESTVVKDVDEIVSLEFPIEFDAPIYVSAMLGAAARRGGDALFSNTAKLSAITVADLDGNPITNFTATGLGGTNYVAVAAVPEPSSFMLMSIASVAFASRLRGLVRHCIE